MRWNDLYISACATSLGRREPTELAVVEGRYDAEEREADDYRSVCVAADGPAVEMAVDAASLALKRGVLDEIDLVVHSSVAHQGLDHFAPASYIQGKTVGGVGTALEVKQFSNGGLAAMDMAAAFLSVRPGASALLTTSDKFVPPVYDRYRSDRGVLMADGATAMVLSRDGGVARLLSTAVLSDGTYGAVYIGDEPWTEVGGGGVDLRARREQYLADNGGLLVKMVQSMTERQLEVVRAALADADMEPADVTRWVFANVGRSMVDWRFRRAMGVTDESRTTWHWGRGVGHLGAGDQVAGLTHLLESGEVAPGDRVVLCGVGMGFSYGSAVVEILDRPEWSNSAN